MTVSAGLTLHQRGESMEATLERADQALYRAKHQGRNCVVLAEALTPPPLAPAGLADLAAPCHAHSAPSATEGTLSA